MQAFQYLENFPEAVPYVFLITDGAVANERDICRRMQSRIAALGPRAPRISTFGIGGKQVTRLPGGRSLRSTNPAS